MASETNFDIINVTTTQEARERFLEITEDILLSKINVRLEEDVFIEDVIRIFKKRTKKLAGIIGGSAAVIAGAGVATVGAVLIPFTFGGSVGIMASGALISAFGAGVSVVVSVDSLVKDNKLKKPVKLALVQLCNFEKEIAKLIAIVNITHGIISGEINTAGSSEDDRVEKVSVASFPSEIKEKINKSFTNLFNYKRVPHSYGSLAELCEDLAHQTETLKNVCTLILDEDSDYVDAKFHTAIGRAFMYPFDYLFQIPVSSFLLDLIEKEREKTESLLGFWLKHLDETMEMGDEDDDTEFPAFTFVDEHKVLMEKTNDKRLKISDVYVDENSRKFGKKILKIAEATSAAKLIVESSVDEKTLAFLGNSNFDFLGKDKEDWSSAYSSISNMMYAVKSLSFSQDDGM